METGVEVQMTDEEMEKHPKFPPPIPYTVNIPRFPYHPLKGGGVYAELGWVLCPKHFEAALSGICRIPGTRFQVLIIVHPVLPLLPLDV